MPDPAALTRAPFAEIPAEPGVQPFWISPDGTILAAHSHGPERARLRLAFRLRSPSERSFLESRLGELQFSERSTLARLGIEIILAGPPAFDGERLAAEAEVFMLGPNFPCAKYFQRLLQPGVPVGRLFHAPPANRLTSDEIWAAVKENRIKLPNTIAIDRFGRVSFTPHKVEYTLPANLLEVDHERLVRGDLGRGFLDKLQIRRDIDIVSIPPRTGLLTSCSMYLQEHYVVLNRGEGNFGLHSGAVLLDPIKTWGSNVMLEIYNTSDQVVVNPVVAVDLFRAPRRPEEPEAQRSKRRLAIRRDLAAVYEALERGPKLEAPDVKPRIRAGFRGRSATIDNDALVVRWDVSVRGAARSVPADFRGYRNLAQALAHAPAEADTLLLDYFPTLFEHIELLARLPELPLRRLVFRRPSRYHGFFLSSEAHARLEAYDELGLVVYWQNDYTGDLFVHTRKKGHGFFVREELAGRFQSSTILAFYGSAVAIDAELGDRIRELVDVLTRYFGPQVGILTGGGGGVMGLAAAEARRRSCLTGACFLELEAQPPELGVDFFNTFQETSRHNRQKWFEVADFCLFNTGGIGTLEEIGIELCNLKLGIRPRVPYVFFGDGYWDDLQRQILRMIKARRAPAWIRDYLLFTNEPSEVIDFYRRRLEVL